MNEIEFQWKLISDVKPYEGQDIFYEGNRGPVRGQYMGLKDDLGKVKMSICEDLFTHWLSMDDMKDELKELCGTLHGCDCESCPVYVVENKVPNAKNSRWGCDCFKDGESMLSFILK